MSDNCKARTLLSTKIHQIEASVKQVRQDFEDARWTFLCDTLDELEKRIRALEDARGIS